MSTMLLALAACVKEQPVSVSFNSDTYQMTVGDTLNLAGELVVANYDKRPLLSVDVDSIVDVKADGRVVALAEGEAVITATADGVSASCTVVVSDISLEKVTLTAPAGVLVGEVGAVVKAAVEPKGYSASGLDWKFSAVPENLQFEYAELRPGEYNVKVKEFVKDAKVTVIVSGKKETAVADTAVMAVVREVVLADRILLDMPARLTGGVDGVWAPVSVKVEPAEYDLANLVWNFTATDGLDFKTEEVTPGEYKVSFSNYVEGGKLSVEVRDANSETFNKGDISVLEKPVEGAATLVFKSKAMTLCLGDEPWTPELICEPGGYDPYLLEWSLSDTSVAALEDGKVTPLKAGETELTVKDMVSGDMVSGKKAVCKIEVIEAVEKADIVSININVVEKPLQLKMNEDIVQLTATCKDASENVVENYTGLEWMAATVEDSFGQQIAIVEVSDRGVVTPKYVGTTYVTVRDKYRPHVEDVCHVQVTAAEIKVEKVNLSHTEMLLAKGYSIAMEASVLPVNAEDKTIRFKSSNKAVVSVAEDGLVTGNAIGEADVYAIAANGVMSKCHVKVVDKALYLDLNEAVMANGAVRKLVLSRVPEDGFSGNVSWTSSNTGVVTVSNDGTMTAVGEGNAKVTASIDGFAAECAVEVVGSGYEYSISFEYSDPSVELKGLQQDMTFTLIPEYVHEGSGTYIPAKVEWKSSAPGIATVDADGNVTAVVENIDNYGLSNGKNFVITLIVDGRKEKSVEFTVVKAQPKEILIKSMPSVDGVEGKMMHGESFVFETEVLPAKAIQAVAFYMTDPDGGFKTCGNTFEAAKVGTYNFTAYVETGSGTGDSSIETVQKHFSIEVLPVLITDMAMTYASLDMTTGSQTILDVNITPSNASYRNVVWSSSNESVASVDQRGVVMANAAGEAVITATHVQNDNSISCSCVVTVTDPVVEINIGDYYYSDGTTSAVLDPSKTVIGVVFAKVNASASDEHMKTDFPDCTRGLVVSVAEYASPFAADRDWDREDLINWMSSNGYTQVEDTEKYCGYSNTKGFMAINEAAVSSSNGDVIRIDLCNAVSQHRSMVTAPQNSTGWYAPSFAELKLLYESLDEVNSSIEKADGAVVAATYVTDYTRPGDGKQFEYTRNRVYWPANMNYYYFYGFDMTNADSVPNPSLFEDGNYDAVINGESAALPVRIILAF